MDNQLDTKDTLNKDVSDLSPPPKSRTLHVFHNTIPSCKMVLKKGQTINFIGGRYHTANELEIAELQEEIAAGNPHLRIIPGQETILEEDLDPMEFLKKKFIAEYLAAQSKSTDKGNQMGDTAQERLRVQTSSDVASATGDSTSNSPANIAAGAAARTIKVSRA